MRVFLVLMFSAISALAQMPLVRLLNTSRPASKDFQVGDQFEILVTGRPKQPISVRTSRQGRMDWGPVIASTDDTGRWSITGRFEKPDFGDWTEVWTVGGKLANPAIHFDVGAPCLPGAQVLTATAGLASMTSCETAEGPQSYVTPSLTDPLRTPDGRIMPGQTRAKMTPDEYHMEILQSLIAGRGRDIAGVRLALQSPHGGLGDEVADLIARLIGVNALSQEECRNVLAVIREVFSNPRMIAPSEKVPAKTSSFLQHLADSTEQDSLKQQILETIAWVQAR